MKLCASKLSPEQRDQMTDLLSHSSMKRFKLLATKYDLCPHCALYYTLLTDLLVLQKEGVEPDDAFKILVTVFAKVFDIEVVEVEEMVASTPPHRGTIH